MSLVTDSIFNYITSNYDEMRIAEELDEEVMNWVDRGQMEEDGIDEFEWYSEYGNGEAEDAIIKNLTDEAQRALQINTKLSVDEQIDLYEKIKEHYDLRAF